MALGAMEAVKARGLTDVKIIGFDALPEALAPIRDGGADRHRRAVPGRPERARRVQIAGRLPAKRQAPSRSSWSLLTPIAITKDNLDKAERIGEIK